MINTRLFPAIVTLFALTTVATTASASAPAGVWALIDKVSFEPEKGTPARIRIDGLFIVANQTPDFPAYPGYSKPKYGYMYYYCAEKQIDTCLMEWKELNAVAGAKDNCRGWGDNSLPSNGTVRTDAYPLTKPDLYPIAMGVLLGVSPCKALRDWSGSETKGATDPAAMASAGGLAQQTLAFVATGLGLAQRWRA
ncbi:MAG: hypothetical protein ABW026_09860 [Microvirga sp.]